MARAVGSSDTSVFSRNAQWLEDDIDKMVQIPNVPDCVFCFWVGMPFSTQIHILELCARCPTIDSIAVYRDGKWSEPEEVLATLEGFCRRSCSRKWVLVEKISTSMFVSGEKHEAWVFRRTK
uniref:Uncharacterized protein n=1 Tax=Cryptomonas curvata TaxID=233186 RepID=A0A7S0LXB4_9CRYP|mmetsp:Transcript_1365/g.2851  ORF Transcript_1365/g.2851 Transcript_1365/m.2851 type:complete len:122 (+) Transcript_1365:413-778(+)